MQVRYVGYELLTWIVKCLAYRCRRFTCQPSLRTQQSSCRKSKAHTCRSVLPASFPLRSSSEEYWPYVTTYVLDEAPRIKKNLHTGIGRTLDAAKLAVLFHSNFPYCRTHFARCSALAIIFRFPMNRKRTHAVNNGQETLTFYLHTCSKRAVYYLPFR
jgi:hypothetical protein